MTTKHVIELSTSRTSVSARVQLRGGGSSAQPLDVLSYVAAAVNDAVRTKDPTNAFVLTSQRAAHLSASGVHELVYHSAVPVPAQPFPDLAELMNGAVESAERMGGGSLSVSNVHAPYTSAMGTEAMGALVFSEREPEGAEMH